MIVFQLQVLWQLKLLALPNPAKVLNLFLKEILHVTGKIPFNTTGGLIGWGHPVGATGVHQAVVIWQQLTGKAGNSQINIDPARPYALSVNMGGDDKTVISIVYKRGE